MGFMDTRKIPVFCYWNGCIKDGPDGPFYEGSSPRVMRVESKTNLPKLLDDLHRVTRFEKGKFQFEMIGRYPCIVQQPMVKYVRLPVVDDSSLETMLEVPSYHPSITNVEMYLEVKPLVSDGVAGPLGSSLANQAMRKRSRQEDADVNVSVRGNTSRRTLQKDNNNGWMEDEESTYDRNCGNGGNNEAVQKSVNMKNPSDSVSKQLIFSSSWLDEHELRVGMLFKDKDELEKAVKLYSCRRQREYYEGISLSYFFRVHCLRKPCGWTLRADKTEGMRYKITEYRGPHTCEPGDVGADFLAGEIECLIRERPSLPTAELTKWVKEEFGYTVSRSTLWDAKKKATIAISGDLDKSFSVLPKFMAALCSSNKIQMNPEARKWLDKMAPHQWALAHDDGGMRFGVMETNLILTTYGFINYVPDLPITTCVLLIFDHLAEHFISQRRLLSESLNSGDKYAKHVMKRLEEYKEAIRTHDVLPLDSTGERFQVTEVMKPGNKRLVVHRSDRVCTCGIWQLYKYPCSHMLAVCKRLNIDHLQYVNDFYNTERSLEAYAAEFNPVPRVSDWPEASETPRLFPPRRLDGTKLR
ncbi:unnamed protein product [Thlaspi arvense]|uniref:SWIM-type domain-containing protein n=1 Tax=Thlaspi arvense TaxID=13288 RepID=A0AAU9T5M4_THLAR|nr:unnamed protein product [Thlaspi arvense]